MSINKFKMISIRELKREISMADNVKAVAKLCMENEKSNLPVSDETTEVEENNNGGISDFVENLLTADTEEERSAILALMLNELSKQLREINEPNELFAYWETSWQWCKQLLDVRPATTCVVNGLLTFAVNDDFSGTAKNLFTAAFFFMQCLDDRTYFDFVLKKYQETKGDPTKFEEYLAWFPLLEIGFQHAFGRGDMIKSVRFVIDSIDNCGKLPTSGPDITIFFVMTERIEIDASEDYRVFSSMRLKWLLRAFSKDVDLQLNSIRFSFEGKLLFLSEGKKKLEDLGLKDGSIIQVLLSPEEDTSKNQVLPIKPKSKSSKSKKNKRKNNSKKKKIAAPNNLYEVVSEEEMHKRVHSKAISKVFEEAERTKFKAIRQQLNEMNLERMKPKSRKPRAKPVSLSHSIENTSPSGVAGEAGKSYTFVQVGEESSLYKTSKPLANHNRLHNFSSVSSARKAVTIDLRGLTKSNALIKLDKTLPGLVSEAMRGEYPFVVLVKIIHGGGSQILAEAVAGWIKQNKQVANAPKSIC